MHSRPLYAQFAFVKATALSFRLGKGLQVGAQSTEMDESDPLFGPFFFVVDGMDLVFGDELEEFGPWDTEERRRDPDGGVLGLQDRSAD